MADLDALAARLRGSAGLRGKRDLPLVRGLPGLDGGDDAALIPHGDGFLVLCAEAISPDFLRADPYAAGVAALVTNVADVRAMGGRPLALVDTLVSPDRGARRPGARRAGLGVAAASTSPSSAAT